MGNPLKKTMVYLGLADEDEAVEVEPARPAPVPSAAVPNQKPAAVKAPVTPLRRSTTNRNATVQEMNEILTVHPRQYRDAQQIAEAFRDGIPVIINLSQMSDGDARRLVDFASGLSQGLYGKIERVTAKVFLLSPANIAVSGEHGTPERENSTPAFFAEG